MNDDRVVSHPLVTYDGGVAPLYLLPIETYEFSTEKFYEKGIFCPPPIVRSSPKRQAEYFYGRLAARRALADFGLAEATIGTGISREPLWPEGIVGSISHNQSYAAAIAFDARAHGAIGIDLETVILPQSRNDLLTTVVSGRELDYLLQLKTDFSIDMLITILFSAKESFFKAAFPTVGRFFGFDTVELIFLDPIQCTFFFRVQEKLSTFFSRGSIHGGRYDRISKNVICTFCNWPLFLA